MEKLNRNLKNVPLRNDEIYTIWTHLGLNIGYIAVNHSLLKHTRDNYLKAIIIEFIQYLKDEKDLLENLLKDHGIALAKQPNAELEGIQVGSCINDFEISAIISMNIATGLVVSSQAIELSVRRDFAMIYEQFHMKKAILGAKLQQLSKEKGWRPLPSSAT